MTSTIKRDPLLGAARILLIFLIAILGFACVMMALGAPALLLFPDQTTAAMASEGVSNPGELIPALAFVIAAVAGLIGLAIYFLVLLYRMVLSVSEGDPFVPANADRLSRMAWIALIAQIASIPLAVAVVWIVDRAGELPADIHVERDVGVQFTGVLLVLTLFILARVFRHGAAMREDLEGTV